MLLKALYFISILQLLMLPALIVWYKRFVDLA